MFNIFSTLPVSPSSSRPSTMTNFIRWLWRSKLARILVLVYLTFSAVFLFSFTHFLRHSGQPLTEPENKNKSSAIVDRTYDTKGLSPIHEIKDKVRFNKMHSKMPQVYTDSVIPYYLRAYNTPEAEDVSATAFVTENRLEDLLRLTEMWQGPISATFHLPAKSIDETDPAVRKTLLNLKNIFTKNSILRRNVDVHLVAGLISSKNPEILPRPTNFHLNVARFFARSDFVMFLDHDTWPSSNTRSIIRNNKHLLVQNDVIVLPTFIFTENATTYEFPDTHTELLDLVNGGLMGLQDDGWELGSGPTSLNSWANGDLYSIEEYELHYRPNFVSKKGGSIPWCTERFDDNKAACLYQMYITGSELWVIPDAFLIRHHLNPDSHLLKPNESKWAKAIDSRMYTKYYREACIHYARQFVMAGEWDTNKAQHLKNECNRVLINWGKGLIEGI
ncbi:4791_t:CDS:2 [Ambispora gerdemannii]|uniref:4791_t:CDS:1 n=1 Tax=Ambispora gerdemannii TaxID=144530 RepID=A0A9N8V3H1_9GLOM|nr:4791_t:CDS:2 [Ambispora gerdemannii]